MKIGDYAETTRAFSARDVRAYVALCGGRFPDGVLPEPLLGALFSNLLGVELPGIGTNYLKQESEYPGTVKIGETLNARVEVTRLRPHKNLVDLETTCRNGHGELVLCGRALVHVSDVRR